MFTKSTLLILLIIFSSNSFAENIIYKCTNFDNSVMYTNKKENKNCIKTNLANIDQGTIVNKTNNLNLAKETTSLELIVPGLTVPKTPPSKLPNDISVN